MYGKIHQNTKGYRSKWLYAYVISAKISWIGLFILEYNKPCVKRPLKTGKTKILMTNGGLMKVKSITECSPWCILQYFWPALSNNWSWKPIFSLFERGRFTQVLLYLWREKATCFFVCHRFICILILLVHVIFFILINYHIVCLR